MKIKLTNNFKDVESWSNRDILLYFLRKYKEFTSKPFEFPNDAWVGLLSRIKGFREKMNLTPLQYKEFIDSVFSIFFTQKDYVPTFGTIVSEKVFYKVKSLTKNRNLTNEDFEKLKKEIYSKDIFKRIEDV